MSHKIVDFINKIKSQIGVVFITLMMYKWIKLKKYILYYIT